MASSELEEKIKQIRLQNEEIRRRHEEVEADKKHAAKLNALVQLVPSDNWPERKEPPEFSAPPKNTQNKKALNKEHNDNPPPHYSRVQERLARNNHKISQGDGPPPDPKYNFLADSEREMYSTDDFRGDNDKGNRNKMQRGAMRRRGGGNSGGPGGSGSRDAFFKDNRGPNAFHSRGDSLPEYEAWRAERNKIDEARINRQKTADGTWRREWDCNKVNVEKDTSRKTDYNRKDSGNYERRNNFYDNDNSRGHGGNRTFHGSQKNQDYRRPHHEQSHDYKKQPDDKMPVSPKDDRHVSATDKNMKVTVNHGSQASGPVMSVKVNSPSIAGTGRVGPRQKSRVTYSSQSDAEVTTHEIQNYARQSFDEKTTGANFDNGQKSVPKSPFSQRKKESNSKSYPQKKEFRNEESKSSVKSMQFQKGDSKDLRQSNNYVPRPQRVQKHPKKLVPTKAENAPPSATVENDADKFVINENYAEQNFNNENSQSDKTFNKSNFHDLQSNVVNEQSNNVLDNNSIEKSDFKSLENDVFSDIGEYNEKLLNVQDNESSENNENVQSIESIEINNESKNTLENYIIEHTKPDENVEIEENLVDVEVKTDVECAKVDKNIECLKIIENIEIPKAEDKEENKENSLNVNIIEPNEKGAMIEVDKDEKVNEDKSNIIKTEENAEKLLSVTEVKDEIVEQKYESCKSNIEEVDQNMVIENADVLISENIEENKSVVEEKSEDIKDQINGLVEIQEDNSNIDPQVIVHIKSKENEIHENEVTDNLNDKSENESCQNIEDFKSQETFEIKDYVEINEKPVDKKMTTENEVADNIENKAVNEIFQEIEDLKLQEASIITDNVKSNENVADKKSDATEIDDAIDVDNNHNESVNDSGFIDDSVTESDAKGKTEKNFKESVKSDLLDITKEICEKTLEICDNHNTDSSETSQPIKDLSVKNEEKQDISNTLENLTKENNVEILGNINKNLESSKLADVQKEEIKHLPTAVETSTKESTDTIAEEVKID